MTGTTASYANDGTYAVKGDETEPLGQKIELTAPPVYNSTYDHVLNVAKDPEWQCEITTGNGNSFRLMPRICQDIISNSKTHLFVTKDEKSPNKVTESPGRREPPTLKGPISAEERERRRTIAATGKPSKDGKHAEDEFDCDITNCTVTDPDPDIPMVKASIPGQTGVKARLNARDQKRYDEKRQEVRDRLNDISKKCLDFLTKAGLKVEDVLNAVNLQNAYDGEASTISMSDAGYYEKGSLDNMEEWRRDGLMAQSMGTFVKNKAKASTMIYLGRVWGHPLRVEATSIFGSITTREYSV